MGFPFTILKRKPGTSPPELPTILLISDYTNLIVLYTGFTILIDVSSDLENVSGKEEIQDNFHPLGRFHPLENPLCRLRGPRVLLLRLDLQTYVL